MSEIVNMLLDAEETVNNRLVSVIKHGLFSIYIREKNIQFNINPKFFHNLNCHYRNPIRFLLRLARMEAIHTMAIQRQPFFNCRDSCTYQYLSKRSHRTSPAHWTIIFSPLRLRLFCFSILSNLCNGFYIGFFSGAISRKHWQRGDQCWTIIRLNRCNLILRRPSRCFNKNRVCFKQDKNASLPSKKRLPCRPADYRCRYALHFSRHLMLFDLSFRSKHCQLCHYGDFASNQLHFICLRKKKSMAQNHASANEPTLTFLSKDLFSYSLNLLTRQNILASMGCYVPWQLRKSKY